MKTSVKKISLISLLAGAGVALSACSTPGVYSETTVGNYVVPASYTYGGSSTYYPSTYYMRYNTPVYSGGYYYPRTYYNMNKYYYPMYYSSYNYRTPYYYTSGSAYRGVWTPGSQFYY